MKTATQKIHLPIEVNGIPGLVLTVSVSARKEMLDAMAAQGVDDAEIHNLIQAKIQEVVSALDGSVSGLIVSNLEDL
jgi:hypothetical protein